MYTYIRLHGGLLTPSANQLVHCTIFIKVRIYHSSVCTQILQSITALQYLCTCTCLVQVHLFYQATQLCCFTQYFIQHYEYFPRFHPKMLGGVQCINAQKSSTLMILTTTPCIGMDSQSLLYRSHTQNTQLAAVKPKIYVNLHSQVNLQHLYVHVHIYLSFVLKCK